MSDSSSQGRHTLGATVQTLEQSPLPQSRETGEVLPQTKADGTPIAGKPVGVAKSWAHFVAGG